MNTQPEKTEPQKARRNSKRSQKSGIKQTPSTKPTNFLKYGESPYKILSYAKFRGKKPFTVPDYRKFCLNAMNPTRIDASLQHLTKVGYITKLEAPYDPQNFNVKNMYKITLSGEHALIYVGRAKREQQEKEQRRLARINGLLGNKAKQSKAG